MPSTPSRSEVENLHRMMMQASAEASQLEKRLTDEQKNDGLSNELRHWQDAADALFGAVDRVKTDLLRAGTPKDKVEGIAGRLQDLKDRARRFDVHGDLEGCVGHWKALGQEFAQLSGPPRDGLIRLLQSRQSTVDRVTGVLSQARQTGGMLPEKFRKVRELQADRDKAREKYEKLRQQYIEAERNHEAAEKQKQLKAATAEHQEKKAPVPNLAHLQAEAKKKGPVVVRLPDPKAADKTAHAKLPKVLPKTPAKPPPVPRAQVLKPAGIKPPEKKVDPKKLVPPKPGQLKPVPAKPGQQLQVKPGQHGKPLVPANRPGTLVRPGAKKASLTDAQQVHAGKGAHKASGPAKVSIERTDHVTGYATGLDGIGRGGQTASVFFRAENLPESLSIQGTTTLQLGCGVRLDVMPSVQLFSQASGAPLRGRLSLILVSSGGRLGTISPASALDAARTAAVAGGKHVASKLGLLGRQLESAICDLVEDAAGKIFRRAQAKAPQNRLPSRQQPGKGPSTEHHVARFDHALGSLLVEARQAKGSTGQTQKLLKHLDRDHHARDSVAGRLEKTLSHLATATHRTLTDQVSGELRSHLARMDSILARLKGKRDGLEEGAQEIGDILAKMSSIASGKAGSNISEFRKLIEERKGALRKIVGETQKEGKKAVQAAAHLGRLPAANVQAQIAALRRQNPGIDKLLKNASQSQLAAELAKLQRSSLGKLGKGKLPKGGLGTSNLTGAFQALGGGHLAGFGGGNRGGLGSLAGLGGGLSKALEKQLESQLKRAKPAEVGKILAGLHKSAKGSPLNELAKKAEAKAKRVATKRSHRGPMPAHVTAEALLEVFKEHPKGASFARHLAPGGELYGLCKAAQRGPGLPVGQMAQHYLASRGHSNVFNAVSTYNSLVKQGHKPHLWGLGSIGHFVSDAVSSVSKTVSNVTGSIADVARSTVTTVRQGISDFGGRAVAFGKAAVSNVKSAVTSGVGAVKGVVKTVQRYGNKVVDKGIGFVRGAYDKAEGALHDAGGWISSKAHGLWNTAKSAGGSAWDFAKKSAGSTWGAIKSGAKSIANVAKSGWGMAKGAASWASSKAGAVFDYAKHAAGGAIDWAKHKAAMVGEKVHSGIEWVKKTGVVGAIGSGLKKGMSFIEKYAPMTPLGLAIKAGKFVAGGGLSKVWNKTRNLAGKAWAGVKGAYNATSKFLQSPAGQFLVTGLSLAASFIPGGMLVKGLVGAGIGAMTAISEGKGWKGVLAGAAGGALTGALPFLKIGPLAKMGVGALQGGITSLASGGNLKDCLKGAAGGALDAFNPGALKALGKLKGVSAAGKLLGGGKLSKAEQAFMKSSKFAGPLRALEKTMANPKARKMVGALEKTGSRVVKGGIWVSGKAAKAQGVLDKVVGAGDKVHGVLTQVHSLAPGLADIVGDNPVGHFITNVGDLAGKGDDKLAKALEYGHTASDQLTKYRGYLDKGLGYAGVKDPAKAYEKMMARKDLAQGKKGGLERVAKLKLEDHKKNHPELHLAEATGKRTRGAHGEAKTARQRPSLEGSPHETHAKEHEHAPPGKRAKPARTTSRLEQALEKGKGLIKKGQQVAQKSHDVLGKVHGVVEKGLAGAEKVQSGLEQATRLAKLGAGMVGEDTELGKYLTEMADKADHVHGYLDQGIGYATEFDKIVQKGHDLTGKIPGVKEESPLEQATLLGAGGKKKKVAKGEAGTATPKTSPHGDAPAHETEEQKTKRLERAWNLIGTVSRMVQKYETHYAKTQREIGEHLGKGQGNQASLKLMDLGSECDQINKYIEEAKVAARGHDGYTKEIKFYDEWHDTTKKKLQKAIADTKGLGNEVAISGFGITEATHPDIFENTKTIFAVRTKVQAFAGALHDSGAAEHVKAVLAEAKAAKADLQKLKSKYKKDKAASSFLTGGGEQDRLIDESIKKLEAALKGEAPGEKKAKPGEALSKKNPGRPTGKKETPGGVMKRVEGGLKAIDKYRKKAVKAGKKVDATLGKLEKALGKGIAIGKKVDGGLEKVAGLADQVAGAFGADSEIGHFAHQVGEGASKGHEKLHDALNLAKKGKSGLHKGREIFHKGLELAAGHHEKQVEKVHGKKPAGGGHAHGESPAELVKHASTRGKKKSPHGEFEHLVKDGKHFVDDAGDVWKDGKKIVHDGKKFVHDAKHAGKDAAHMFHDGQKMWKTGKKSVHDVEKGARHLKHGMHDVSDLFGHLKEHDWKGALASGKALIKDGKVLLKDGKTVVGDAKKLFGQGKHLWDEGKHLWGDVKHAAGDAAHLVKEGWDFVTGLFGGKKKSPHDTHEAGPASHKEHTRRKKNAPHEAPASHHGGGGHKDQWSEADIAQVVNGALGWVASFGKAVSSAIKEIGELMAAGKTKEAGDRVQAVTVTSEQARFEVTRAVSTSGNYPALAKQAKEASKHYLEIRKHFFDFVKGLHGLGGETRELPGVDGGKYPELLALSTDIDSLKVKVDSLGDLKHADTPMQGPVADLKKEASGLRSRVDKAKGKYAKDPAAGEVVEGLSSRLLQIEKALGSHTQKPNIAKGDKDLGIPAGPRPQPQPRKKPRRRRKPDHHDGDDHRLDPNRGGHRGDTGGVDGQEVDPAAADTWIGSGEGVKLFSEVFGAFLPAEGAVVHHHAGKHPKHGQGGGIGIDLSGKAHGQIDVAGIHAQGGIGGNLHAHLGRGGLDVAGGVGAGGSVDAFGMHLAGGIHAGGQAHIGADGIHLEGGLDAGVDIMGHHFGVKLGGSVDISMKSIKQKLGKITGKATGFFKGLFDHLHGFADKIAGWAGIGAKMLGQGMHFAEMGMHGLSAIEKAAAKVQGMAGKAEGFLSKMGLGKIAGFAGKIGGAAGWVSKESKLLHGGLKTADKWMGKGKKVAGTVGGMADKASGAFDKASHGRFGALVSLFKASKDGDGVDGKLVPEKMRLGSQFDEPRRLDVTTMSRMEMFLGGDFSGVRIHTGQGAAQVTNRFAAEAVTVKDHIFFAPGRFNPSSFEGQRLLAHELTHVMQKGRPNLDVRTAESEALRSEHTYFGHGPEMEPLNLRQPSADFRIADGEGVANTSGVYTAKRNRSRGHEAGGKDSMPDGEEFIEQISSRVYELLMEELEHSFESR